MATVTPFRAFRYADSAGAIERLVTQPYDKIDAAMRERYLSLSPHNLVRIILGAGGDGDTPRDNVYTRAAAHFREWVGSGVLVQDTNPAFYAYFQDFADPDTGAVLTRKGFIGLGQVEDYGARVVHRHEQTLAGPKKDRLEVLRHTHAHFGQIFMLYPDPEGGVDGVLDQAAVADPAVSLADEYGARHRLWPITDAASIARIQTAMADKKLVIADGHHRYETALNFRNESPLPGARRVMMTFVNMNSAGLRILATHRLVSGVAGFSAGDLLAKLRSMGSVTAMPAAELKSAMAVYDAARIRIGVVAPDAGWLFHAPRTPGALDVRYLHERVLEGCLGISPEAVREEKHLAYVRGIDSAVARTRSGEAQVALLLQPTRIEEVAEVSFSGGVMPQKSTDFYPKLLSGIAIYSVEQP